MESSKALKIQNSISTKLLKVVFFFYFILTFLVTSVHLIAEYYHIRSNILHELAALEDTFKPPLATAIYEFNQDQVAATISGMIRIPTIVGVKVMDHAGEVIGKRGSIRMETPSGPTDTDDAAPPAAEGDNLFWHHFDIDRIQNGETTKIGEVFLYSSPSVIFDRLKVAFGFIIINAIIKTAALCLLFILVFRKYLTRPLAELTSVTRQLEMDTLDGFEIDIPTRERNELTLLGNAFNDTVKKLADARAKIMAYTDELKRKNDELLRMDRLKDEFLANTSHELRTPLNGIIGIAESLLDGAGGRLPAVAADNLKMIVNSGRRLSGLVNSILDFSSIRHRKLQLDVQPLLLHPVVQAVVDLLQPLAAQKGFRIENAVSGDLPGVMADEDRLIQILQNLIGNALKFTETGGVEISAKTQDTMVLVSVKDTGIGIPADQHGRIFESFEQADGSTAREYGGTGLGLAIVKNLVELHGGSIQVSSEAGRGSCFTFALPSAHGKVVRQKTETGMAADRVLFEGLTQPQTDDGVPDDGVPAVNSYGAGHIRILVVDDEPVNLQVAQNNLRLMGFEVATAASGMEAIYWIEHYGKPDVMLLDVMMPRMSGYETCRKIRSDYSPSELPIIVMTAKNQVQDLVEGFKAGANDYLTKPFSRGELMARIDAHLRLSAIRNELVAEKLTTESLSRNKSELLITIREKTQQLVISVEKAMAALGQVTLPPDQAGQVSDLAQSCHAVRESLDGIENLVEAETGSNPDPKAPIPSKRLCLLCAEDNLDDRLILKSYFKKTPHRIDFAENGAIAVEKFKQIPYDLVLMDLNMPEKNGVAATREIREWERQNRRPPAPILALTADAKGSDIDACLEAGFTAHLSKPVQMNVLFKQIDAHVQGGI